MPLDPKEFDKELEGLGEEDLFTLPADRAIVYFSYDQNFVEYVADNKIIDAEAYRDMEELVRGLLDHVELIWITLYYDTPKQKVFIGDIYYDPSEKHWDEIIKPSKADRSPRHMAFANKLIKLLNRYLSRY